MKEIKWAYDEEKPTCLVDGKPFAVIGKAESVAVGKNLFAAIVGDKVFVGATWKDVKAKVEEWANAG